MLVENGLKYGQMTKDELERVNATGGINGHKIEVILLDDECKPDKGVANVNRFIHQHKVHLVIGSTCSSVSMPMVDSHRQGGGAADHPALDQLVDHAEGQRVGVPRLGRRSASTPRSTRKYLAENVGKKVAYLYTTDGAAISFAEHYTDYMKTTYNVEPVYSDADAGDRPRLPLAPAEDQVAQSGRARDRRPARMRSRASPSSPTRSAFRRRSGASRRPRRSNAPVPELAGDAAEGLTFAAAFTARTSGRSRRHS